MKFNEDNLLEESYFLQIKKQAEEYITFDMFREAFDLSRDLENALNKSIKTKSPKLYQEYLEISTKLKWVGLNIMKEENIIDLFHNHFTKIYEIENYDVWYKTKTVLISVIVLGDRDKLKSKIKKALLNNKEKLTKNKIIINNKENSPTTGNWLLDYNRSLGSGVIDKLKLTQYLTNGENIKKLDEKDKKRLRLLFNFFERLKPSSLTLEGVEEDIPIDKEFGDGVITQGVPQFYKTDNRTKQLEEIADRIIRNRDENMSVIGLTDLEQAAKEYPVGSLERKAIEEEITRVKSQK